jgi:putative ubiquitin-RnfH superfamily antitoxin RatB of RatAB toxin-antitoxin module
VKQAVKISVIYALPDRQIIRELDLDAGATVAVALARSGLTDEFPEIEAQALQVGIFGQIRPPETSLRSGDRVEIYRPLLAEPKEARRKRVRKG